MSLNDQYEHSRIPLKPLPYENRRLADCNEIMIDYSGDNPSYHIYIVDSSDKSKYIDITALILKATVGEYIYIKLDGMEDPISLNDLLNFIYKNFVYPENKLGFIYERDKDLLLDPETKAVLLRDTDGTCYTPVVRADSVFDTSGRTVQERLDQMTRLGFSMDYVRITVEGQNVIDITYPFLNYRDGGNFFEIRIGTTFIDKTRYQVIENRNEDGDAYGATITFLDNHFEVDRRIDIMYIYNAKDVGGDINNNTFSGGSIANSSIPSTKLEKTCDNYYTEDSTSIATAKSVYSLYRDLTNALSVNTNRVIWCNDTSTSASSINIQATMSSAPVYPVMINFVTKSTKNTNVTLNATYKISSSGSTGTLCTSQLYLTSGVQLKTKLPANHLAKIVIVDATHAYLIAVPESDWTVTRYIRVCKDQETVISYADLSYTIGAKIFVYRNGVRQFEDYNYSINPSDETITLYVRAEEGETIIFEAISLI